MIARRAAVGAVGLLVALTVIIAHLGDHRAGGDGVGASVATTSRPLASVAVPDHRIVRALAVGFVTTVVDPAPTATRPTAQTWARFVTPGFARQLTAQPPVALVGADATGRVRVVSVTAQPGPPVTALVLAEMTVTATGQPAVRVPVTWQLTVTATQAGWRIAGVRS